MYSIVYGKFYNGNKSLLGGCNVELVSYFYLNFYLGKIHIWTKIYSLSRQLFINYHPLLHLDSSSGR